MQRRLITAFLLALYLAFLTRSYFWDGVMFSLQIEEVYAHHQPFTVLFHANHLLYSAFGYVLYWTAQLVHVHLRAIYLLQAWNALVGILVCYRVWTFAKEQTSSSSAASFCTLLFAFGATWWKFATDADPYMISVWMLQLGVLFALEGRSKLATVGACHVCAMLFHELAVFGYVPILMAIITGSETKSSRWLRASAYTTITGCCVVVAYYLCYRMGSGAGHPTLLNWVTNYAPDTTVTRSLSQVFTTNAGSYVKLFVGGKLSAIRQQFSAVMAVSLGASSVALIWFFVLLRRDKRQVRQPVAKRTRYVLWAWLGTFALFLAWFDPGNAGHKLFLWPALALLIGTARWSQLHARSLIALAVAIAAWNFGAFIYPHSRNEGDPLLTMALEVDRQMPKDAHVYYAAFSPDDWYLDYFAPGRRWMPLTSWSGKTETAPICFDGTALDRLGSTLVTDPSLSWHFTDKQRNIRLECLKQTP